MSYITHQQFQKEINELKTNDEKLRFCLDFLIETICLNNVDTQQIKIYLEEQIKLIYK
jgi:hypothetical protein